MEEIEDIDMVVLRFEGVTACDVSYCNSAAGLRLESDCLVARILGVGVTVSLNGLFEWLSRLRCGKFGEGLM